MIEPQALALFVAASLVLIVTPGPDMLLVIARSLAGGPRDGVLVAAGLVGGLLLHTAVVALGLAALLAASALAFNVLKWAGAAYLVWLGVQILRHAGDTASLAAPQRRYRAHELLAQGFLSAALNPKLALFFLAFLPQFADGRAAPLGAQLAVLGVLFTLMGCGSYAGLSFVVGRARRFLASRARAHIERAAGALLILVALRLAFAER
ncbi:MAG: LysE family translocator [Burkholderiales bacterium]|nr:LysE family translocator [Burkholderiales bacterium]